MGLETTHTPQGDGNRLSLMPSPPYSGNNPHPARGRKLFIAQLQPLIVEETTHTPQGDGNMHANSGYEYHTETTHTPQGDGNCCPYIKYSLRIGNNPHPARGRKLIAPSAQLAVGETTHTPQGDGNCYQTCGQLLSWETTHTPQGGGKPFVFTLQKLLEKPFTSPTGDN